MTLLSIPLAMLVLGAEPVAEGHATRYNPGVMETVVENRLRWGQLDLSRLHDGHVALADCDRLDDLVWIRWPGGAVSGPHLVTDCGAAHDQARLAASNFAVDLYWPLARRFGVIDDVARGVQVYDRDPVDPGWR